MDFWPLMDGISHLEDQGPRHDVDVLLEEVFMFCDGLVMIGNELDEN